jgi:hypothetical protein
MELKVGYNRRDIREHFKKCTKKEAPASEHDFQVELITFLGKCGFYFVKFNLENDDKELRFSTMEM